MKVIPLGTSSGKPTLKRNVSGLALVREGEWLLFDCGECMQIQIARAGLSPARLSAIFITHLHGDHFNGLPGLLSSMGLDRRVRELTVVGPPGVREYVDTLARLKTLFVNYPLTIREVPSADQLIEVFSTSEFTVRARALVHRVFSLGYRVDEKPRTGRFDLAAARRLGVPEGPMFGKLQAGESVQLPNGAVVSPSDVLGSPRPGKSVAYCLDTRRCDAATELGRDVDLLIHEATYTDELKAEAWEYGHSTAADAGRTALEAQAGRLMLTHYSTRFSDLSPLLAEAKAVFDEAFLAEELLAVDV
jgi:ribonuclease Z